MAELSEREPTEVGPLKGGVAALTEVRGTPAQSPNAISAPSAATAFPALGPSVCYRPVEGGREGGPFGAQRPAPRGLSDGHSQGARKGVHMGSRDVSEGRAGSPHVPLSESGVGGALQGPQIWGHPGPSLTSASSSGRLQLRSRAICFKYLSFLEAPRNWNEGLPGGSDLAWFRQCTVGVGVENGRSAGTTRLGLAGAPVGTREVAGPCLPRCPGQASPRRGGQARRPEPYYVTLEAAAGSLEGMESGGQGRAGVSPPGSLRVATSLTKQLCVLTGHEGRKTASGNILAALPECGAAARGDSRAPSLFLLPQGDGTQLEGQPPVS